ASCAARIWCAGARPSRATPMCYSSWPTSSRRSGALPSGRPSRASKEGDMKNRLVVAKLDGHTIGTFELRGDLIIREGLVDDTVVLLGGLNKPQLFSKAFPIGTTFEVM